MSSFICSTEHFRELALYAAQVIPHYGQRVTPVWLRTIAGTDVSDLLPDGLAPNKYPETLAAILYRANAESVGHRYPNDPPIDKDYLPKFRTAQSPARRVTAPVSILKMCDCLEYQSNESPDWPNSTAHKIIAAIRGFAISELPGYGAAPWEYCE